MYLSEKREDLEIVEGCDMGKPEIFREPMLEKKNCCDDPQDAEHAAGPDGIEFKPRFFLKVAGVQVVG